MARRKNLIAKLLTPKKKKRKKSAARTQSRSQNNGWRYTSSTPGIQRPTLPDVEPYEVPKGPYCVTTYIYDGRPLKGTRKGSKFQLDIVRGQQAMTSVYTKTRWTSAHAIAYKGQLIGFINDNNWYADLTKQLLNWHERVVVHAERLGTDPGGWPIIELMLPARSWFEEEPERAKHRAAELKALNSHRVALLWQLKDICNQKGRCEYVERTHTARQG